MYPVFSSLAVVATAASLASAAIPAHLHPKRHLFERQAPAGNWPPINTIPPASSLPQVWRDALNDAKSAGKIPDLPQSTLGADGNPSYPSGTSLADVCNWTLNKCLGPNDIHDAPQGVWAIAFDDGPSTNSPELYTYLAEQQQSATHFMIGSQILTYPAAFMQANASGGQLAVHTWSHKLQSANSDEEITGDLAWTMQIIYNMTGRIPNVWRPPQGDVDNRVRAIAEEVLGMRTVMWDFDGNDWCLQDNNQSSCPAATNAIGASYETITTYINNAIDNTDKSTGAIMLAHEINKPSIAIFKDYYPTLSQKGWDPRSIADFNSTDYYANAKDNTSPTSGQDDVIAVDGVTSSGSGSSQTRSGSSSTRVSTARSSSTASSSSGDSASSNSNASTSGAMTNALFSFSAVAASGFMASAYLLFAA